MKVGDLLANRYRLIRPIGEGGMGSVWAAHHELIGRHVAIKITHEVFAKRREIRDRFLNEARAVGMLRHPNIIDVMDVGQLPDGPLYIVFELLDGMTLADHLENNGKLAAGDAALIVIEVCHGLEAAHAAGVVHRDLKPANIFLHRTLKGGIVVKLLDFGISKAVDEDGVSLSMTQTGVVMGTPQYMSTEQARGRDDVDLRTDIWSAGAILYELATGSVPFEAGNYNAMIYKIMHEEPPLLSSFGVTEPALQSVVSRSLTKQRSQRFQSARELRTALEALLPILPTGSELRFEQSAGRIKLPTPVRGNGKPAAQMQLGPGERNVLLLETMMAAPPLTIPPLTPLDGTPSMTSGETPESDVGPMAPSVPVAPSAVRRRKMAAFALAGLGVVAIAGLLARRQSQPIEAPAQAQTIVPAATSPVPAASSEMPPMVEEMPKSALDLAPIPSSTSAPDERPPSAEGPVLPPVAAGSSRKKAISRTPRSTEAPRPKPVTRVESAGF